MLIFAIFFYKPLGLVNSYKVLILWGKHGQKGMIKLLFGNLTLYKGGERRRKRNCSVSCAKRYFCDLGWKGLNLLRMWVTTGAAKGNSAFASVLLAQVSWAAWSDDRGERENKRRNHQSTLAWCLICGNWHLKFKITVLQFFLMTLVILLSALCFNFFNMPNG